MRKLLLFLLVVFFGSNVHSQAFATVGAKWTYQVFGSSGLGFPVALQFRVEKDTVIDERYCTIINSYSLFDDGRWEEGFSSEIVASTTNGDTVYVYFDDSFHIIYDFTAEVGDTINVTDMNFDGFFTEVSYNQNRFIYKIDSIASVCIDFDTLRIQYVSHLMPPMDTFSEWGFADITDISSNVPGRIVKGIGSLNRVAMLGTSNDFSFLFDFEPDYLTCYEDNDRYIQFSNVNCDSLISIYTSTDEWNQEQMFQGSVYPNPFNRLLNLNYNPFAVRFVRIFDVYGREVQAIKLDATMIVDLSQIQPGIYFLSILLRSGNIKTHRIIKI